MLNLQELVKPQDRGDQSEGYTWFEVKPGDMYPAMAEYMVASLLSKKRTDEKVARYHVDARRMGENKIKLILVPYDEAIKLDAQAQVDRNAALECARLWFTAVIHKGLEDANPDGPSALGLQILKDPAFRLT